MPYSDTFQRGAAPTYADTSLAPLIPEDLAESIIQGAVEKSACARFMTRRKLARGIQRQAVLDTLPTAYFLNAGLAASDTRLKQTTTMSYRNVFFNVEEVAVILPIPEALLADIDYNMWEQSRPKIEEAFGAAIDAAILFGTNAPLSWPTAIATAAIAAGNTVTVGTGVDIASDISNAFAAVEADGYEVNGVVHRQDLRGALRNLRDTTNAPIFLDGVNGISEAGFGKSAGAREGTIFRVPARAVKNGVFEAHDAATANATRAIQGDWEQAIFATRQDLTMKISGDATLFDQNGDVQYQLFQQDMVAARFVMRVAWAVPNPVNRTNQVTATRYPFSVLRDAA